MSNNNAYSSKVLWGVLFTALFAFPSLVSCGGGGPTTTVNTDSTLPAVSLSATSTSIAYGATSNLNWTSANSTSCTSSGGGGTGITGSFTTPPLTTTTTYTVTCTGAGGSASQSIAITVASSALSSVISGFADAGGGKVTVTTANTLTNGFAVTISGTTSYDGTYTVENRTATTYDITATFVADDATGIWQLAGGMIPGCSTTGSTGAISLSNAPSRFSGVAPLSVFFDASGTTATATTRPFHDLEYQWNFGDSTSGILNLSPPIVGTSTWNTGSRTVSSSPSSPSSRNTATGPVSAHVYETPGIYTVALTARDGTNTVSNSCAQIVVYDPEAVFSNTTACVANAAMPVAGTDGCPAVATLLYNSNDFDATMATALAAGARRVLFKRGDTFTANASSTISAAGSGMIGAYGVGSLPYIQMGVINQYATLLKVNASDWRIMDLAIDGTGTVDQFAIGYSVAPSKTTILRVTETNLMAAVTMTGTDQLAVVDSNFSLGGTGSSGSNVGVFCNTCTNVMLLGNSMYLNTINSHNIRLQGVVNFVVSNSTQVGSNLNDPITVRGDTQYGVLSDNKFVDDSVTIRPQSTTSVEYQRDIIVERNWFVAGVNTSTSLGVEGSSVTIRNNIFDLSLGDTFRAIAVAYLSTVGSPMTDLVNVYNNTIYNSFANSSSPEFYGIRYQGLLDGTCHSEVKNNLAYSPNSTGTPVLILVSGGVCNITGASGTFGNSSNTQIKSGPNPFTNPTPSNLDDFNIAAGSYAHDDTGVTVPVFSDFFRTDRPRGSKIDMGAIEGP